MRNVAKELNAVIDLAEVVLDVGGDFPTLTSTSTGQIKGRHGALPGGANACLLELDKNRWVCFKRKQEGCAIYHGGPIEWVLTHKYDGEPRFFRDAVTYLCNFYGIEVTEDPLDIRQHQVYELLTELADIWHAELMANPEVLNRICEQYGLTKEGVAAAKIGLCNGIPEQFKSNTALLIDAGLVSMDFNQPLASRVVLPYYVYNQVTWFAGRTLIPDAKVAKYTCLYTTSYVQPRLYAFEGARRWSDDRHPLFITEGLFDAAKAQQEGLRCVALGGLDVFTPTVQNDLETLFNAAPDPLKYIVFDAEASNRGRIGAVAFAQKLLRYGVDPFILDLPRPADVNKVDLCDYLKANGRSALLQLARDAVENTEPKPTVANILIQDITPYTEHATVRRVMELLSCMPSLEAVPYIESLAKKKGVTASTIKKEVERLQKERKKTVESRVLDEFPIAVKFGQDIRYDDIAGTWRQYRCIWQPVEIKETFGTVEEVTTVLRPLLLQVKYGEQGGWVLESKSMLQDKELSLEDRKNIPPAEICTVEANQWSMSKQNPYSYVNFVEQNGTMTCPVWSLFRELKELLAQFVWLANDFDYDVIVGYALLSYVYSGFSAIPYLQFKGEYGSGKSQVNYFLNEFAYNAMMTSNMSPAVLYRVSHALRGLLIIDEAERLSNPKSEEDQALLSICNGGYQGAVGGRGAPVLRCDTSDVDIIRRYDTYCPKVFISTKTLPDTLASRSILIETTRVPKEHQARYVYSKGFDVWAVTNKAKGQMLRDQLHIFGLTALPGVMRSDDLVDHHDKFRLYSRDRQIWRPLLAVLHYVYGQGKADFDPLLEYVVQKQIATAAARKSHTFQAGLTDIIIRIIQDATHPGVLVVMDDTSYINLGALTTAITNEMMNDKLWTREYEVSVKVLSNRLREMNHCISPQRVRRTDPVTGQKISVYPFFRDRFDSYAEANNAAGKGLDDAD